jgi:hypothetical protein
MTNNNDLKNWKLNAEENYINTPISVLKYITELEKTIDGIEAKHEVELDRKNSGLLVLVFMSMVLGYFIDK